MHDQRINPVLRLRERLRTAHRMLIQWESRANAWLGNNLKNPMCRCSKRPRPYGTNNRITRTG